MAREHQPIKPYLILSIDQNGDVMFGYDDGPFHRKVSTEQQLEEASQSLFSEVLQDEGGPAPEDFRIVVYEARSLYVSNPSLVPISR